MTLHVVRPLMRPSPVRGIPPLENGDRLSQPEFHRRYEAMPENFKAELIGGVVYVASPVRNPHGEIGVELGMLLGVYKASTPGVRAAENVTTILSAQSEPQPDLLLRIEPQSGGRCRLDDKQYLVGPPDLVIEVAHSTIALDLHKKLDDYRSAGVREYLVVCVDPGVFRAFDLAANADLAVDAKGVFRSAVFPGLWIDAGAVLGGDASRALKTLARGLKTRDHAKFVEELASRASSAPATRKPRSARRGKA